MRCTMTPAPRMPILRIVSVMAFLCVLGIWYPLGAIERTTSGQPSKDATLASSVGSINQCLRNQFREISACKGKVVALLKATALLRTQLKKLAEWDSQIPKMGTDKTENFIRSSVLRDRAQAFLHA